jgi:hypothetical protein
VNRRVYEGETYFVLVFHSPFRIWFARGARTVSYEVALRVDDNEMKRSKGRAAVWRDSGFHCGWIGGVAVLSNNKWVALVKIDGFKLLRPDAARICPEIDSVRIYAENNMILRTIP